MNIEIKLKSQEFRSTSDRVHRGHYVHAILVKIHIIRIVYFSFISFSRFTAFVYRVCRAHTYLTTSFLMTKSQNIHDDHVEHIFFLLSIICFIIRRTSFILLECFFFRDAIKVSLTPIRKEDIRVVYVI